MNISILRFLRWNINVFFLHFSLRPSIWLVGILQYKQLVAALKCKRKIIKCWHDSRVKYGIVYLEQVEYSPTLHLHSHSVDENDILFDPRQESQLDYRRPIHERTDRDKRYTVRNTSNAHLWCSWIESVPYSFVSQFISSRLITLRQNIISTTHRDVRRLQLQF